MTFHVRTPKTAKVFVIFYNQSNLILTHKEMSHVIMLPISALPVLWFTLRSLELSSQANEISHNAGKDIIKWCVCCFSWREFPSLVPVSEFFFLSFLSHSCYSFGEEGIHTEELDSELGKLSQPAWLALGALVSSDLLNPSVSLVCASSIMIFIPA